MSRGNEQAENALDCAAAVIFASAVAYCASIAASVMVGVLLAPLAFAVIFIGLSRVDGERRYQLADFALHPIEPLFKDAVQQDETVVRLFGPGPLAIARSSSSTDDPGPDAGQALSDALAQLKQSLR